MAADPTQMLQSLATLVLALSAANERLVEAIKNLVPWLAEEKLAGGMVDPNKDRWRQLAVQVTSIVLATGVAAWAVKGNPFDWGTIYTIGTGKDQLNVPAWLLGLLTSGGSAFWNSMLDFARAAGKLREKKT